MHISQAGRETLPTNIKTMNCTRQRENTYAFVPKYNSFEENTEIKKVNCDIKFVDN
jgi:hypothetical protein